MKSIRLFRLAALALLTWCLCGTSLQAQFVITNSSVSGVTTTTATLNAMVQPAGGALNYYFRYGPTTNLSLFSKTNSLAGGTSFVTVSAAVTNLTANTNYYFSLVLSTMNGTFTGSLVSFQTAFPTILVTNVAAGSLTANGATLNAVVNPNGILATVHFQYGLTTNYGSVTSSTNCNGTNSQSVASAITNLIPNTPYHFRVLAANSATNLTGADATFTTPAIVLTNVGVVSVNASSAVLTGGVNPNGTTVAAYFQYGTTLSYGGFTTTNPAVSGFTTQTITGAVSNLTANTLYHFRLVAVNTLSTNFSADFTGTTVVITLTNVAAGSLAANSAQLTGVVNPNGTTVTASFQYGTNTNYGNSTTGTLVTGSTNHPVAAGITNLLPSTLYHFRLVGASALTTNSSGDFTLTTPPIIVTNVAAGSLAANSAQLTGAVNPNGAAVATYFQYGTNTNYGSFSATNSGVTGVTNQPVNAGITNLQPNTLYHFRLLAANSVSTETGVDATLTTPPIIVTNGAVVSLTPNYAQLSGVVNPNGATVGAFFRYGVTTNVGNSTAPVTTITGFTNQSISVGITNLLPNTLYYFRLVAANSLSTESDVYVTLTTPAIIVTNVAAGSLAVNSAQLTGVVNPNGTTVATYFQYGTNTNYGSFSATNSGVAGVTNQPISAGITNLLPNTLYHFRLVAANSLSTVTSGDFTLTTPSVGIVSVGVASLAANSAKLTGTVNPNGSAAVVYFQYGTTTSYGQFSTTNGVGGATNLVVTGLITNLGPSTLYHFQLVAVSALSATPTSLSGDFTLTTPPIVVTNAAVASLAANSAQLTGVVNPNGATVSTYFQYGLTANYTGQTTPTAGLSGVTNRTVTGGITNLLPNTVYHFRLVAFNSISTVLGADATLTTPAVTPTNLTVSSVRANSVQLNGVVNPNGTTIYSYFQFGATTNYGSVTPTVTGIQGLFPVGELAVITNLQPASTYHFRMVVANGLFTNFSGDVTFSTLSILPSAVTVAATIKSPTTALLNGLVNPNGLPTTTWFQWGTTLGYGHQTAPVSAGNLQQTIATNSLVGGLLLGRPYHFRVAASNAIGTTYGVDQSFILATRGIALNGANPTNVECHGTFVDPGAYSASSEFALAGGYVHSLALRGDNVVVAWGANEGNFSFLDLDFGQAAVPVGLGGALAIGAGTAHSIAVLMNGTVSGWGDDSLGQIDVPAGLTNAVAVSSGDYHNLALKSDGTVAAWGWNEFGQTNVPPGLSSVVAVAAGGSHSLALQASGQVSGWGENSLGEATPPANLRGVVAISAGDQFSLALKADGTVTAWGDNAFGETSLPPGLSNVVAIAAGGDFALALLTNGTVVAWGDNTYGQSTVPPGLTNVVQIAAGYSHALAQLGDGSMMGWGWNDFGQVSIPAALSPLVGVISVTGTVDTTTPGTYALTYSLSNAPIIIRTVVVADTTPPVVTLLGANPFNLIVNSPFVDPGASAVDTCAGNVTNIVRTGPLNTNAIGTYTLTYTATDTSGNPAFVTRSVVVSAGPPTVTTMAASSVAPQSATLNAGVNPDGASGGLYFQWGTTTSYGNYTATNILGGGVNTIAVPSAISGLTPATTYHFQAVATNGLGTNFGADLTFTTPATSPSSISVQYSWTATTASLNETLNPDGAVTTLYFKWGTTTAYGNTTTTNSVGGGSIPVTGTANLSGLIPGTTYHFQAWVANQYGTNAGSDHSFTTLAAAPVATTLAASAVTATSATLNGQVNPDAAASVGYFQWGLTTAYSNTTAQTSVGGSNVVVATSNSLTGLAPFTTYHYRAAGSNSFGSDVGADLTFTTLAAAPAAVTVAASAITATSATLNGTVNPNGAATAVVFLWGTTTNFGNTNILASLPAGNVQQSVSNALTGLSPVTTYYYAVVATNSLGSGAGPVLHFATAALLPIVTTQPAVVNGTSATLNGLVTPNGATAYGFFNWGATTNYGSIAGGIFLGASSPAAVVSNTITGLTPGSTYHFRVAATNSLGTNFGTDLTFTIPVVAPAATTVAAGAVTGNSATLNGTVNPNGAAATVAFLWGTTTNFGNTNALASLPAGNSVQSASSALSGLSPNTTYYFTVTATNTAGSGSGQVLHFATLALPPTVTTQPAVVNGTSVTLKGLVTPNGATTYAFFNWGATTNYGSIAGGIFLGLASPATAVSNTITGLNPGSTYHFRVVATNSLGTNFGSDLTITIPVVAPAATTVAAGAVTGNSATLNGTVNPNGAATTVAFLWGTTTNFGNTNVLASLPAGNSAQSVSKPLTGLSPVTIYYYAVVATNTAGSGSGQILHFTTLALPPVATTQPAAVNSSSATLNGLVNPNGTSTSVFFNWGATTNYGGTTAVVLLGAASPATIESATIGGLTPAATYHFRVVATNSIGTNFGADLTFIVPGSPPVVTTVPASAMTQTSAVLNGFVIPANLSSAAWFEWGATTSYGNTTTATGVGSGSGSIVMSNLLTGLIPLTTYHFRLDATNAAGVGLGSDSTFTTLGFGPSIIPQPSSFVTGPQATLNALVVPNGSSSTAWFEWGTNTAYGSQTAATNVGGGLASLPFNGLLAGLTPGTVYHYRAVVTNSYGISRGLDQYLQPPQLTLVGTNMMTVPYGSTFVDPGAVVTEIPAAVAVAAGHVLALKADGTVVAWGTDFAGETDVPSGLTNVVEIYAQAQSSLALRADGTIFYWGQNSGGAVSVPPQVQGGNTVMLSGAAFGGVVLTTAGSILAWGDNNLGEINLPPAVGANMAAVAGGKYFGLGLTTQGQVLAWGLDEFGQVDVPANVTNIVAIWAGDYQGLALGSNGTVYDWGIQNLGAQMPVFAAPVVQLSGGYLHSLALLANGTVVGWGDNSYGEISIPAAATNIVAIGASGLSSLALRADGTLIGWGDNTYGNLNVPAGLNILSTPVSVSGSVDTSNPGTYQLTYTATNASGVIGTVTRTVVVPLPLITVQNFYHLGDNDSGAAAGQIVGISLDGIGNNNLTAFNGLIYVSVVSPFAAAETGSQLSVGLDGISQYLAGSTLQTLTNASVTDNFGLEAWVYSLGVVPSAQTQGSDGYYGVIAYNGSTSLNGFGLLQASDNNIYVLFGNVLGVEAAPLPVGAWTHVALVENAGVTTLYTNGVAAYTVAGYAPNSVSGQGFCLGAAPEAPGHLQFPGVIDDVRFFTFAPGAFNPSLLLVNTTTPTLIAQTALGVTANSAVLGATVNPNGSAGNVIFQWGTTTSLGNTSMLPFAPNTSPETLGTALTGLASGTTYYYSVSATSTLGGNAGAISSFTTSGSMQRQRHLGK